MKRLTQILAWLIVTVTTVNLFASAAFRINRFLDRYSWWIKRGHRNYMGKDQSLLNLISSVFLDYCFVLPYIAIVIFAAIKIARGTSPREGLKKGAFLGLFLGGALSSAFIAVAMIPRSSVILQDGTAEWALAWLPFIWIGYPSLVIGAVLGLLVAFAHGKIVNHSPERAESAQQRKII
jgi:hypothetical protein